jgi:hypothetical protein
VRPDQTSFKLWVSHPYLGLSPAGDRLRKGGVYPVTQYTFPDEQSACEAAVELEGYVNQAVSKLSAKERKVEAERKRLEAYKAANGA